MQDARFLSIVVFSLTLVVGQDKSEVPGPLSVLLITSPFAGHATPCLALGEELVRRGHDVTVVSAPTDFLRRKVEEANVSRLWSIGDRFMEVVPEVLGDSNINDMNLHQILSLVASFQEQILNTIDNTTIKLFDIAVGDAAFTSFFPCFSHKWNIPSVSLSPTLFSSPFQLDAWPFPQMTMGYTDNLSFFQRLATFIFVRIGVLIIPRYYTFAEEYCKSVNLTLDHMMRFIHHIPQIITSSIGFEFPRTLLPLTEYVGPILSQSPPQLPQDIAEWLDSRDSRSVVYVSMGSAAVLSSSQAESVINGATQANFSVVWSLRKTNQHILDHTDYDADNVLVSDWVPQLTLLRHPSINSAVLHGGLGGIQEALSCGVPIIVIPFFADQIDNAARVQYHHYGERIYQHELTTPLVTQTLRLIDSELYRKSVQKLQRIFKKDGGVSRAADLVEFYSEVGYEHLVPAYAKYNWSWIEFYNVDVYTVLILAILLLSYLLYRLIRYCCSAVFSRAKKKDE